MKNIKDFDSFSVNEKQSAKQKAAFKKMIDAKNKKDTKKKDDKCCDDKNEKKVNINKSDEEKYLTDKQRKLPAALKSGIIKRMKKKK